MEKREEKIITTNRKAWHDYHINDRIEAGICLMGSEVKSLRAGQASLADAYIKIEEGETWLINSHIPQFKQASYNNHEPRRKRKLLLHSAQIRKLISKVNEKGIALIPLKLYFSGPHVKVEIGLCTGKRQYDKRTAIKERDAQRDMDRALAEKRKS